MALSPPQVEPWRLKQGTEAMDSWRGNFIDRIYYLLTILSFICRAFCDGIVLVHLEKGQQAVRDVQQSEETEACHHFQAILEQTMVSWWLITTDYTIIRNCIFWLHSVSCLILFFLFRAGYRRVWCSLMRSDAVGIQLWRFCSWSSWKKVPMGGILPNLLLFSALRGMWEAPDVSIRPSQTKVCFARIESWSSASEISISSKSKTTRKYKISEKEWKEGGDELTGVNWVPVDPATHQATKIACGVRTWIKDVQFFQK